MTSHRQSHVARGGASQLLEAGEEALVEAAFCTGEFSQARQLVRAARAQAARDRDEALEAAALDRLGMVQHYANITRLMAGTALAPADVDFEEALFRRALEVRERRGDRAGMAQSAFGLGLAFQVLRGDWRGRLTDELIDCLQAWNDDGDTFVSRHAHQHSDAERIAFRGRGRDLAEQAQQQLGDEYEVHCRSPPGLLA